LCVKFVQRWHCAKHRSSFWSGSARFVWRRALIQFAWRCDILPSVRSGTCQNSSSRRRIGDLGPDPEHGVDVLADVDVGAPDQLLRLATLELKRREKRGRSISLPSVWPDELVKMSLKFLPTPCLS
jgi:hypothetical protein